MFTHTASETIPVEARTRIGFAPWCYLTVTYNTFRQNVGVMIHQQSTNLNEVVVLNIGKNLRVSTFQFNSDGKVIAIFASPKTRFPGVPCPTMERHVLSNQAVAINQQMGRYP